MEFVNSVTRVVKLVLALLRMIVNNARFLLMLFLLMEGVLPLVQIKKVLFQVILLIVKLALMNARHVQDQILVSVYLE
jgi:hypothetical protein